MKELLDKLSSYHIFNCLLPGILFALLLAKLTPHKLIQTDIILGVFIYYFLGLICSRVGSLVVGAFLKKIKFVEFEPYKEFVIASEKDSKIELLSEVNNMYRTFLAMFLLLAIVMLYDYFAKSCPILVIISPYCSIFALLWVFLDSYKKQTNYIKERMQLTKNIKE
jgi:hypothetical protein